MTENNTTFTLTDAEAEAAIASMQFPTFVYGTLRPEQGNDHIWRSVAYASYDGKCRVLGYRLVSNGGFPYAIPATTEQTFGCLINPLPDEYEHVMRRMDALEGVPHHYTREQVAVITPDGIVTAYIYIPVDPERYALMGEVFQNDWALHRRKAHTGTDRWRTW